MAGQGDPISPPRSGPVETRPPDPRGAGASAIEPRVADGRHFADDDPSAPVHDCAPDQYRVRYDFALLAAPNRWVARPRPEKGLRHAHRLPPRRRMIDDAARLAANRRHWDDLTAIHLAPGGYDLARLDAAAPALDPIVDADLAELAPDLAGVRVVHLQCHIGLDSLILAKRGASVVGVDFSPAAIAGARDLAAAHGLAGRARFVECDLYDAPAAVDAPDGFDLAYATWGAIGWLPDIRGWARVAARLLAPGGRLYLADAHPTALVFDDLAPGVDGMPGWFAPYFERDALTLDTGTDYANPAAGPAHPRNYAWMHPLGDILAAVAEAGLALRFLREHDRIAWPMFGRLVADADGMWRWPDRPWLPLAVSLAAEKPGR